MVAAGSITDDAALQTYRNAVSRQFCVAQLVTRLSLRIAAIQQRLVNNIRDRNSGRSVPRTINDFRIVFTAIGRFLTSYTNVLSGEQNHTLVNCLASILGYIQDNNRDLYQAAANPQPAYASTSSVNLYASFCSNAGQPGVFVETLGRLPDELLHTEDLQRVLRLLWNQIVSTREAGNQWARALRGVHDRKYCRPSRKAPS